MVLWSNEPCHKPGGGGFKSRSRQVFWKLTRILILAQRAKHKNHNDPLLIQIGGVPELWFFSSKFGKFVVVRSIPALKIINLMLSLNYNPALWIWFSDPAWKKHVTEDPLRVDRWFIFIKHLSFGDKKENNFLQTIKNVISSVLEPSFKPIYHLLFGVKTIYFLQISLSVNTEIY